MNGGFDQLATSARAAGDRLLHARPMVARQAGLAHLVALVTPAPPEGEGPDGPLFGVPVTVKDSYETAGLRTTASHPPLAGHIPTRDAALVARLRASGAVILGKTNLSQLCGDIQCASPVFGTALNPWDTTRTPGGSSGGGAVAVLTGLSRLDLGSDLAGSLRIPAAFCGVAALKAGPEVFDMAGHIPPLEGAAPPPFQSGGFLARDCADLAAGFAALSGQPAAAAPQGPLRLGLVTGAPLPLCPRTEQAMHRAAEWLAAEGAQTRTAPLDFRTAWQGYGGLLMAAAAPHLRGWQRLALRLLALAAPRRPLRQALLRGLAGIPPGQAEAAREATVAAIDRHLETADALLCPVTAVTAFAHLPPPRLPLAQRSIPAGMHRIPYQEAGIGFTTPFSLSGHPVVVIPVDLVDGLPVGLQIIGRRGGEAALIALASRIEAVFDRHRPPLWQQWQTRFPSLNPHGDA